MESRGPRTLEWHLWEHLEELSDCLPTRKFAKLWLAMRFRLTHVILTPWSHCSSKMSPLAKTIKDAPCSKNTLPMAWRPLVCRSCPSPPMSLTSSTRQPLRERSTAPERSNGMVTSYAKRSCTETRTVRRLMAGSSSSVTTCFGTQLPRPTTPETSPLHIGPRGTSAEAPSRSASPPISSFLPKMPKITGMRQT